MPKMQEQDNIPLPTQATQQQEYSISESVFLSYPLVSISYCVKCKWMLRASWYQQELLQTFSSKPLIQTTIDSSTPSSSADSMTINSIILRPSLVPGTFKVALKKSVDDNWIAVWDRTTNDGFPDSKNLKQLIRNELFPNLKLNHIDKPNKNNGLLVDTSSGSSKNPLQDKGLCSDGHTLSEECLECVVSWEG